MGRLDNYEEVKDRLKRVHAASNDIRFTTQVLNHNEDYSRVVIKAFMYEGEALIATGIAMDWQNKDRNANRTNWVEVAETSAIGRAIANSKFQDPNAPRASLDEMRVANERAEALDTPNTQPQEQTQAVPTSKPAWIQQFETRFSTKVNEERVTKYCIDKGQIKAGQRWRDLPMAAVQKLQKDNNKGLESLCRAAGVTL